MSRYPLVTPRPCGFDASDCLSIISRTRVTQRCGDLLGSVYLRSRRAPTNSSDSGGGSYDAGCSAASDGRRVQHHATVLCVRVGFEYYVVRDGVTPCNQVAPVTDVLQRQPASRLWLGLRSRKRLPTPFSSAIALVHNPRSRLLLNRRSRRTRRGVFLAIFAFLCWFMSTASKQPLLLGAVSDEA